MERVPLGKVPRQDEEWVPAEAGCGAAEVVAPDADEDSVLAEGNSSPPKTSYPLLRPKNGASRNS